MIARLRLILRETLGTAVLIRTWAGFAAQVGLCSALLTAVGCALETSSRLGGETGGVFRASATPASVVLIIGSILVTSSVSRLTQDSVRPGRTNWIAANVTPRLAGIVIASQSVLVAVLAAALGGAVAWTTIRAIGSVSVPTDHGDVPVVLRSGAPTFLVAATLLGAAVLPSLVSAVVHPYSPPRRRLGATVSVAGLLVLGWVAVAITILALGLGSATAVQRSVALTLLSILTLLLLSAVTARWTVPRLGTVLATLGSRGRSTMLTVSTSAIAVALSRSTGSTTPTLVATTLVGGFYGVFLVGDDALEMTTHRVPGGTVNGPAILGALAPVVLLCLWSSVTVLLASRPDRGHDARVLRRCGLSRSARVRTAALEGALVAAIGIGLGTAVVVLAVWPLAVAAHLSPGAVLGDVFNEAFVAITVLTAAVLTGANGIAAAASGRERP